MEVVKLTGRRVSLAYPQSLPLAGWPVGAVSPASTGPLVGITWGPVCTVFRLLLGSEQKSVFD